MGIQLEVYHDVAKDWDTEPETQAETQTASAQARPKRMRFQSIGQPPPEIEERLQETDVFHGWKEQESQERFEFNPSLVSNIEAQEDDGDGWQLIKSQHTKWELIRGHH